MTRPAPAQPRPRPPRSLAALLLTAAGVFAPLPAQAQPTAPKADARVVRPDLVRGLEEPRATEAEDVLLAAPRAILAIPGTFVGLLVTPVRQALRFIEKHHIVERVEDVLYNDERTAAILPVITLSTFFGAQIGVEAFHENLGGHGESGRIKASWGVDREQVYTLSFAAAHLGGTPLWVESTTSFEEHPSLRFYGLGGDGVRDVEGNRLDPRQASVPSFYAQRRFRQLLTLGATIDMPGLELRLGGRGRFKAHAFEPARGLARGDRQVEAVYDTAQLPGYERGAEVAEAEGVAALAARDRTGKSGHAFYGELFAGGALPFRDFEYAQVGAELTGYVDLYKGDRLLVLRAAFQAIEGDDSEIPFVELPSLGGAHRLRGYPLNRFRDEKAFVTTVEYQYPVHEMLAGTLFLDVGEVSQTFAGMFEDPHFHLGGGGGLIIRKKSKVYLSAEIAGGEGVQVVVTTDPLRAFADRDDLL